MPPSDPPRPPLTDEERRLLTDPAYFAEVAAQGPVVLADRTVENLSIRDQRFTSVEWRGVDFVATNLASTTFTAAQLSQVTFTSCKLEQVVFERCRLADCAFEFGELERLRLTDTSTQRLSLAACVCSDSVIERVEFDSAKDAASSFARLALRETRWQGCEWHGTRFDQPEVNALTVTGGTLAGVTFTDARGRGLLVQGTLIDGLDFVLGTWVALTFDQVYGRCLRLTEVAATGVSLLGCGELVGVAVAGGSVTGLAIDRCPTLGLVGLAHTSIRGLAIADSFLDGAFWQHCSIGEDSTIERAVLAGLSLGESTLDGVTIRDTEFTVSLGIERARIQGLNLEGVRYAPDLEFSDQGVTYGPGARFPGRTH
jgi:uncharacterized protein YjbI with pentapeptide repeats